jgi:hypothetical protein
MTSGTVYNHRSDTEFQLAARTLSSSGLVTG